MPDQPSAVRQLIGESREPTDPLQRLAAQAHRRPKAVAPAKGAGRELAAASPLGAGVEVDDELDDRPGD